MNITQNFMVNVNYYEPYEKIYQISDLYNGNIESLLKYGQLKPSYEPRKLIIEGLENNPYFKKYNSYFIEVKQNSIEKEDLMDVRNWLRKAKKRNTDRFLKICKIMQNEKIVS